MKKGNKFRDYEQLSKQKPGDPSYATNYVKVDPKDIGDIRDKEYRIEKLKNDLERLG